MTRYASGRRKEWAARKWLEARGYTVTRSAGSKGLWDLVGVRASAAPYVVLAQVKYTAAGARWKDDNWHALHAMKKERRLPACAQIVAIVYTRGNTEPELFWGTGW